MEPLFERDLEKEIGHLIDRKEIIVIRGPRQCGKTTLLKVISQMIKGNKNFIDMDIIQDRSALEKDPMNL